MVMTLLTRAKKTVATVIVATDGTGDYNCDGTADNVEIQAAIDSVPATGGCIYIKEGTYNLDASITILNSNISIMGCGDSTLLRGITPIIDIGDGVATYVGIEIRNLRFDGENLVRTAINVNDRVVNLYMMNCTFENCWASPLIINGVNILHVIITENFFNDCIVGAIAISNIREMIFTDNIMHASLGLFLTNCELCTVSSNESYLGVGNGIELDTCEKCIVSNNHVVLAGSHGIELDDTNDSIVEGNIIDSSNYGGGPFVGIAITGDSNYNTINGNQAINISAISANQAWGIRIWSADADDNVITNNTCRANVSGAISDAGTNTQIFNNKEL